MKRPLGIVALLYGGGLVLAEFFHPSLSILFGLSLSTALAAIFLPKQRTSLIWPLVVLTGWTNLAWRTAILSPNDLRCLLPGSAEEVCIRGRLLETPSERIYIHDELETSRTLATLSITAIQRNGTWQPAFGKVIAITPGTLPSQFFAGQEVEISGVIAPPSSPLADGLFDYRAYLERQGIYFQLKPSGARDWKLVSTNQTPPLSDRFLAWAKDILGRGLPSQDKPLRLLWAMTLGSKNVLTAEAYDPFVESGTMHIFAISGLHIALIAAILVSLLRVVRVSRNWCGAVVIPLIWFYTAATGWQPSAIRSTLMMTIVIAGWSLKRPSDLLNSLATAALIILLLDPQQLFQASFQLSFFVVLSIALCLPPLERFRDRLLRHDPLLPIELIPRWKRWLGVPLRFLTTCLATSFAAWLGAWPLTVYYFHLFSPVTLLANLVIVPMSSLALACNLGSLICGSWFPWAAELFNHSAWFWMSGMMKTSELTTKLPGAFFYTASPTFPDFVIYYGALIVIVSGFALAQKRRRWMIAALSCVVAFYGWRWHEARTTTQLSIVPTNGGCSIYCDEPGSANDLLVNCGNDSAVEFVVIPFLHAQGVNRLPHLALTHGASHQIGGTLFLRELLPINEVFTSKVRFRSSVYRRVTDSLQHDNQPWRQLDLNDRIGSWTVLHPKRTFEFQYAEDAALVLRGELQGVRVLLLSDLNRNGQEALLENSDKLRADIVVTGVPNNNEPLRDALLDAIQPRLIIIADSEYPVSKRASRALVERLESRHIPVFYTRLAGAVTVTLRKNRWMARPVDGETFSGKHSPE